MVLWKLLLSPANVRGRQVKSVGGYTRFARGRGLGRDGVTAGFDWPDARGEKREQG